MVCSSVESAGQFQLTALHCNNTTTFNLQRPRPSLLLQVNDHHRIMRTFIFPILVLGHFSVVLMKPIPVALTGMAKEEGFSPSPSTSLTTSLPSLPTGDEANAIRFNGKDSSPLASTPSSPHSPKIEADVSGLESGSSSSTFGPNESNVPWSKLGRRASANPPVPKDSVEANTDQLSGNPLTGSTINPETFRHPEGSRRNSVSSTASNFGVSETSTLSGSTQDSYFSKSLIPNSSSKSSETDKIIVEVEFEELWRGDKLDPPMPYTNPQANVHKNWDDAMSAVAVDIFKLNSLNEPKKKEFRTIEGNSVDRSKEVPEFEIRYTHAKKDSSAVNQIHFDMSSSGFVRCPPNNPCLIELRVAKLDAPEPVYKYSIQGQSTDKLPLNTFPKMSIEVKHQ
ncbi:hypothetical protein C8R42DRAFT_729523 [Lentinula raphanica]|nr:hypothetical protein C8R42DRAFT_729523 [Lentinula raphanica]